MFGLCTKKSPKQVQTARPLAKVLTPYQVLQRSVGDKLLDNRFTFISAWTLTDGSTRFVFHDLATKGLYTIDFSLPDWSDEGLTKLALQTVTDTQYA